MLVVATRLAGSVLLPLNHSKVYRVVVVPTIACTSPLGREVSQDVWLVAEAVTAGGVLEISVMVALSELHYVVLFVATTV